MCLLLRFFIVSYLVQLCLSAAGIFDDYDLFASNLVQPDAGDDGSQLLSSVEAPLTNLDSYESNLDPLNGLDLGGLDSDFNIFTSDESVQDQAADVPYRDSMAGGENECSLDGLPASRIRARGGESCVTRKKQPTLDLKLPTLGSLPAKKKLPSPSPINGPAWAEITNPETCPMSFRESYYIPICGTRLGDVGLYTPTELNGLRGWTVTDATICKSRVSTSKR